MAYNFNISIETILRANNFDRNHILRPGEIIKIPPVSGVLHYVVS
ncbi:MAG: LysM peptidoglycan-binding domain-containing protein [Candidatus Peribacteria bacterium]|nr:LysM peptidoglycan-binding domain-containing protein [Candidatus Peribacteria bacterium]